MRMGRLLRFAILASLLLAVGDRVLAAVLDRLCTSCSVPVQFTGRFDAGLVWKPADRIGSDREGEIRRRLNLWTQPLATPEDPIRILLLGDGTSYAAGPKAAFPGRIIARLASRPDRPEAELIDFSVPGYSTFQIFRLAEQILKGLHVDLLIVASGLHDQEPVERSDASWLQFLMSESGKFRAAAENSGWVRLARYLSPSLFNRQKPVPRVSRVERELLIERLARLLMPHGITLGYTPTDFLSDDAGKVAALARALGVITVEFGPELKRQEVDIPTLRQLSEDPDLNHYRYTEYLLVHRTQTDLEAARDRIAAETGLPLPDPDAMGLFRDRSHPNDYGHEYLAILWERRLSPALLDTLRKQRLEPRDTPEGFLPGGVPMMNEIDRAANQHLPEAPE